MTLILTPHVLPDSRLITGRQRNTWPWWWGIAQCPGDPRRPRCVKRSTPPCWPVGCLLQTSPAALPAPGCRRWRTGGEPSGPRVRRSWRWTRSSSCSAAKSAAPWCCPSSPPPGKLSAARSKSTHPPGSCWQGRWREGADGWRMDEGERVILQLIGMVFSCRAALLTMPQLHWITTSR